MDEHHKSNELDLTICGKTDLYNIHIITFMEFSQQP